MTVVGLVLALLVGPVAPADAVAVQVPPLTISAEPAPGFRPRVRLGPVLDEPALQEAVNSGLPLRLHLRVELWRDGFFDRFEGAQEWNALIFYQPLEGQYATRVQASPAGGAQFTSYDAARHSLERDYTFELRPPRSGRYYYLATLEIETLSLTDLDELGRWLRGELQPAVAGDRSLTGAVTQGLQRLLIRVLRLPTRRFEARSGRFVAS